MTANKIYLPAITLGRNNNTKGKYMSYTTHGAEWVDGTFEATSDPRNGDTTTMNGIATTKEEAIAQALSYRNNGWSVSIKQLGAGDRWSVTAT